MAAKAQRLRDLYGSSINESISDSTPADRVEIRIHPGHDDRLAGTGRLKGAMMIPIGKIIADPDQPRKMFGAAELDDLARSIRTRGVLHPLRVRWVEHRSAWMIVTGERRWKACCLAGIDMVPAIEVPDRDKGELLADQLLENCSRQDLTPIEQANAIRELIDLTGWDQSRAGEELGISKGRISMLLTLLRAPEQVQQKVASGELSIHAGYDLARVDATTATTIASVPQDTRSARRAAERAGMRTNARTTTWRAVFDEGRVEVVANEPGAANKKIEQLLRRALTELKARV